jgi:hypothetical protein
MTNPLRSPTNNALHRPSTVSVAITARRARAGMAAVGCYMPLAGWCRADIVAGHRITHFLVLGFEDLFWRRWPLPPLFLQPS